MMREDINFTMVARRREQNKQKSKQQNIMKQQTLSTTQGFPKSKPLPNYQTYVKSYWNLQWDKIYFSN